MASQVRRFLKTFQYKAFICDSGILKMEETRTWIAKTFGEHAFVPETGQYAFTLLISFNPQKNPLKKDFPNSFNE